MTNQSTIDKLIEMRLTALADAFRNQLSDPKMKENLLRTVWACWLISNTPAVKTTASED